MHRILREAVLENKPHTAAQFATRWSLKAAIEDRVQFEDMIRWAQTPTEEKLLACPAEKRKKRTFRAMLSTFVP